MPDIFFMCSQLLQWVAIASMGTLGVFSICCCTHTRMYTYYTRVVVYEQYHTRSIHVWSLNKLYMVFVFLYRCSTTVKLSTLLRAQSTQCFTHHFANIFTSLAHETQITTLPGQLGVLICDIFKVLHHNLFSSCLSSLSTSLLLFC